MSFYDYEASKRATKEGYPFYALIMAAMRDADSENQAKLKDAWPDVWAELDARYNAPGGLIPGDKGYDQMAEAVRALGAGMVSDGVGYQTPRSPA